jgi:hypothetical protein
MFSFAALLFFSITGITLNHTSWIEGRQKVEQIEGDLNVAWVSADSSGADELMIVEHFRNKYNIRAKVSDFTTEETECSVSFKGPGYTADGFIDRSTGHYQLTITKSGIIAMMNDLHKGRDTGSAWSWFIDVSAVLMILVSLTGFLMIFFLKKKRFSGLVITVVGAMIIIFVYYLFV